ncbi:hypothetical protein NC651_000382 [Populus alba x Populus x berolinensis]|nr:hypothetical protein NC651_000382 [Populus alba x Populus x berolinensis]
MAREMDLYACCLLNSAMEADFIDAVVDGFGSAVYPSGASVNKKPCFKLVVGIQRSEAASNAFSFVICSSGHENGQLPRKIATAIKEFQQLTRIGRQ